MSDEKDERSVLGNLPSTRPNRLGRARDEEGERKPTPRAAKGTKATAKPARATSAAAKKPSKAKPKPKPKPAATAKAKSQPKPAARKPRVAATAPRPAVNDLSGEGGPQPVRAGAPTLDGAGQSPQERDSAVQPPSGTELVTTVVQAAGELAQIGVTVGTQIVKRAVDRLPKP